MPLQTLHDIAIDFIVPNLNAVLENDEYNNMTDELQKRLMKELVAEKVFVGFKRKRHE